jgi:GABA permease
VTATSPELLEALKSRMAKGPTAVTLVVPSPMSGPSRATAEQTLTEAVAALRDAGLDADGQLGDSDPMIAITETWDPKRYDEIVVSTLPTSLSKWLHADLPGRVARQTGALVTHVVAQPPRAAPHAEPVEAHDKHGVLTPLSPLTWGMRAARH